MLFLVTGGNGAGKTLFALRWCRDLELEFRKKGELRQVYYSGFKPKEKITEDFGWLPCDPRKWMDLPNKSIIIVDEAQSVFVTRGSSSVTPDFEQQIAIAHRERGFDFFIITQHPSNISSFIRRLIMAPSYHRHLKRIMGTEMVTCLEYNYAETDCEKPSGKSNALSDFRLAFPKEVYDWYASAQLHTTKFKMPKKVGLLIFFLVILISSVTLAVLKFKSFGGSSEPLPEKPAAQALAPRQQPTVAPQIQSEKDLKRDETLAYLASYEPRVRGFPHSAPRYDEVTQPVVAPYPAACVVMESKGCICYTQQGTRLDVPKDTCLSIVDRGFFVDWDTKPRNNNEMG